MNFNYVEYPAGLRVSDYLKDAISHIKINDGDEIIPEYQKLSTE